MQSRTLLVAALGAVIVAIVAVAALSAPRNVEAATGGLHTTNVNCDGVDLNLYGNKLDVYVEGGPNKVGASALTPGDYGVEVTAPGGGILGKSDGTVVTVGDDGVLPCTRLWDLVLKNSDGTQGYDDTTNNGGEYKVQICLDDDFEGSDCKSDNFKVDDEETPPPFDACVSAPNRTVLVFNVELGNPDFSGLVVASPSQAVNIAAGTYAVTLQSFDSHSTKGNQGQYVEQWYGIFSGAITTVNTNPISDLPSDQDTLNEAVGNVTFTETMTSLVAHHLLDVGEFTTPESVQPVCLALDLVGN